MENRLYQNSLENQRRQVEREISNLDSLNSELEQNAGADEIQINASRPKHDEEEETRQKLHYEIEDVPPWHLTILLGIQNYLIMAGTTVVIPFELSKLLCLTNDDQRHSSIISTMIFASGIVTILQSTFGTRLPIIQGGSFNFLFPTIAILSSQPECKDGDPRNTWQIRMREIQGAIIIASLFQVAVGFFGIIGFFVRFITPMTVAPSIIVLGLSVFQFAGNFASGNFYISIPTIILIIVFSQYLSDVKLPIPFTTSLKRDGAMLRYPVFQVFPVLLSTLIMWLICGILTWTNTLSKGDPARIDIRSKIFELKENSNPLGFKVPYPFQWGTPMVSSTAVVGMLAGVISGMMESVGDYYACARIVGTKPPPVHAINRGIFIEGLGCIICGIWGTGNGTTSYSENIGAISVTRVGSRRVIQVTGLIMMLCSLFTAIGGIFVSVPTPIVGGVLCIAFAIVTAVGISNLKSVNLNSVRNLFIIGFSTFFALTISQYMKGKPGSINFFGDYEGLNQIVEVMLSTGMFLAGLFGFILDNTIPGTKKERGLLDWVRQPEGSTEPHDIPSEFETPEETYNLPFGMEALESYEWASWLPISPTFKTENYYNLIPVAWLRRKSASETINLQVL